MIGYSLNAGFNCDNCKPFNGGLAGLGFKAMLLRTSEFLFPVLNPES